MVTVVILINDIKCHKSLQMLAASPQNTVFILLYSTLADGFNLSPVHHSTSISWLCDVTVKEVKHNRIVVRIEIAAIDNYDKQFCALEVLSNNRAMYIYLLIYILTYF